MLICHVCKAQSVSRQLPNRGRYVVRVWIRGLFPLPSILPSSLPLPEAIRRSEFTQFFNHISRSVYISRNVGIHHRYRIPHSLSLFSNDATREGPRPRSTAGIPMIKIETQSWLVCSYRLRLDVVYLTDCRLISLKISRKVPLDRNPQARTH